MKIKRNENIFSIEHLKSMSEDNKNSIKEADYYYITSLIVYVQKDSFTKQELLNDLDGLKEEDIDDFESEPDFFLKKFMPQFNAYVVLKSEDNEHYKFEVTAYMQDMNFISLSYYVEGL